MSMQEKLIRTSAGCFLWEMRGVTPPDLGVRTRWAVPGCAGLCGLQTPMQLLPGAARTTAERSRWTPSALRSSGERERGEPAFCDGPDLSLLLLPRSHF